MVSIFLSHSSQDKPFVRELAAFLEQDNIKVWLDERQIAPGDDIVRKIRAGLNADFKCAIQVVSLHAQCSQIPLRAPW